MSKKQTMTYLLSYISPKEKTGFEPATFPRCGLLYRSNIVLRHHSKKFEG
jgi:hypothetical protein